MQFDPVEIAMDPSPAFRFKTQDVDMTPHRCIFIRIINASIFFLWSSSRSNNYNWVNSGPILLYMRLHQQLHILQLTLSITWHRGLTLTPLKADLDRLFWWQLNRATQAVGSSVLIKSKKKSLPKTRLNVEVGYNLAHLTVQWKPTIHDFLGAYQPIRLSSSNTITGFIPP